MPVVIGARFSPYSFDDMLKPLAMAQQEYNTVQEGLSALTDSSNQFSRYLEGTQAGERVKKYNAAIDEAVTDMARNGLRSTNRDTLLGLKRQYNNDIAKINQSAAQLDTLYKGVQAAQLKAQASGDTLFVANMPNVDDLIANPSAAPMMVSGAGLQKQGMQAAQSASVRNILNNTRAGQGVMKMYNEIVQGYGYNSAQAQKFLQDASTIPELQQAIESISSMYNIDALGNDSARAKQFIMQGIMDGLTTQQKSTYMEDPEKKAALDFDYYQKKAVATAAAKASAGGSGSGDSRMSIGRLNSPDLNEKFAKYKKYFTEDGKLTEEGLRQYKGYETYTNSYSPSAGVAVGSYKVRKQDKDFVDFVNNTLGVKDGNNFVTRLNSAWKGFTSPTGEGYGDTSSYRTFDMKMRDTASKALKTQLAAAYGGDAEVPVVTDIDKGGKKWKTKGTVDMEDLMGDEYTIAKVQASPYTGSMIAQFVSKKGGENIAIEVPTSVIAGLNSSTMYNNALQRMQQLEQLSTNNPNLLSTPAYKQAMNEVRQQIEQSMLNHLQHFDQESTKEAE